MDTLKHAADAAEPNHPRSKRRRIALACNSCRSRKSKCDGRRPECGTCEAMGFECDYEPSDNASNVIVQKDYISGLEQRLKYFERTLQRHDNLLVGHLSACSSQSQLSSELPVMPVQLTSQVGDAVQSSGTDFDETATEDARTDGLAITFVSEGASAYFGESSNVSFSRVLLKAISETSPSSNLEQFASAGGDKRDAGRYERSTNDIAPTASSPATIDGGAALKMPAEHEVERLLGVYFEATGALFPFIHEPSFRNTYSEFKLSGYTKVRKTWLALLYMTFAMASKIDEGSHGSAKQRHEQSQKYYTKAVALCTEPLQQSISLEIVQYLLLVVLHLQGAQRSTQTWSMHGMLVQTATALGIHTDNSAKRLDSVQREARLRTWSSIYCLDQVLSCTFGRPPMVPVERVTVRSPAPWPNQAQSIPLAQIMSPDDSTGFFASSMELYKIMGRSITKQYNSNLGRGEGADDVISTIQRMTGLRTELDQWVTKLPQDLTICSSGSATTLEHSLRNKLRITLTLRHHNVDILIHRPLLQATLQSLPSAVPGNPPQTVQLAAAEFQTCLNSARDTIDIVHSILVTENTGGRNLGVWFFTLYYVFSASLVICGYNVWQRRSDTDQQPAIHDQYLVKAAEALGHLDSSIVLIQNCARYIRQLSRLPHDARDRTSVPDHNRANHFDASSSASNGFAPNSLDLSYHMDDTLDSFDFDTFTSPFYDIL